MTELYRKGFADGWKAAIEFTGGNGSSRSKKKRYIPESYEFRGQRAHVLRMIVDGINTSEMLNAFAQEKGIKEWSPRIVELHRAGWIEGTNSPFIATAEGKKIVEDNPQ